MKLFAFVLVLSSVLFWMSYLPKLVVNATLRDDLTYFKTDKVLNVIKEAQNNFMPATDRLGSFKPDQYMNKLKKGSLHNF